MKTSPFFVFLGIICVRCMKMEPLCKAWVGLRVKRLRRITVSVKLNSMPKGRKRIADARETEMMSFHEESEKTDIGVWPQCSRLGW